MFFDVKQYMICCNICIKGIGIIAVFFLNSLQHILIVNSLWYVHVVKDVTFAEKND